MKHKFVKLVLMDRANIPARLLKFLLVKLFHRNVVIFKSVNNFVFEVSVICRFGILIR